MQFNSFIVQMKAQRDCIHLCNGSNFIKGNRANSQHLNLSPCLTFLIPCCFSPSTPKFRNAACKNKIDVKQLSCIEQTYGCQGGVEGGGEGLDWEFGIIRCKLLYIEWINNKVLLYSTGNCTQYLVIIYRGKESGKEYICITESLCCTPETNTTL